MKDKQIKAARAALALRSPFSRSQILDWRRFLRALQEHASDECRAFDDPAITAEWRDARLVPSPALLAWCDTTNLHHPLIYRLARLGTLDLDHWAARHLRGGAMSSVRSMWPQQESRKDLLAPVGAEPHREGKKLFLERAGNHWDQRQAFMTSLGIELDAAFKSDKPFALLVHFQVLGHSYNRIADDQNNEVQSVRPMIISAAKRLGLTLRAGAAGGRPRQPRQL